MTYAIILSIESKFIIPAIIKTDLDIGAISAYAVVEFKIIIKRTRNIDNAIFLNFIYYSIPFYLV